MNDNGFTRKWWGTFEERIKMKYILRNESYKLTSNPVRSGTINSGTFFGTTLKFPSDERERLKPKTVSTVLLYEYDILKYSFHIFTLITSLA